MRIPFPGRSISHADFPFLGEHFSCGFPSRGSISHADSLPGGAFLMRISLPGEHFSCGFPFPGEHFSCGRCEEGKHS